MLAIRAVTTQDEFLALREDWEKLLANAPAANIFLTFDWLATWWHHYGRGAQLYILAAYDDEALIGLAPLMIQERRLAGLPVFRRVAFLGTGISDRLDILLMPGRERAILEAMLSHLGREQWDVVDLHEISEESVTARLLPELAEPMGERVEKTALSVCPVITLAADPEDCFATLGKNLRHNVGRYGRRLRREHTVVVDFLEGGSRLTDALQAFLGMYRKAFSARPNTSHLIGDRFAAFRLEIAERFATQGRLLLAVLRIDGDEVAAELCFPYRGTCYQYNRCYDPAWTDKHVGTILQGEVIRRAITIGCHEYDCLRGDEQYKYRWGAQPRRQVRILITRETARLRILQAGVRFVRSMPHRGATFFTQ